MGKWIGGSDIMLEMFQNGELKPNNIAQLQKLNNKKANRKILYPSN